MATRFKVTPHAGDRDVALRILRTPQLQISLSSRLMLMSKSLRFQMLALLSASLVLLLLIALACFSFLSSNVQAYRGLLDGPLQASQLIDQANVQFKIQVQDWKDVLLRGKQPADRENYWGQFEQQERLVQATLSQLASLRRRR